jgi:hypothetical protein
LHDQRCCEEWKTLLGGGDEPESIDQVTGEVVMPNHHREEEDIAEAGANPRNPNPPRLSWNTGVSVAEQGRAGMARRSIPRFPSNWECEAEFTVLPPLVLFAPMPFLSKCTCHFPCSAAKMPIRKGSCPHQKTEELEYSLVENCRTKYSELETYETKSFFLLYFMWQIVDCSLTLDQSESWFIFPCSCGLVTDNKNIGVTCVVL